MSHWPEDRKRDWDEARIVTAFSQWLEARGWTVETEKDYIDVVAERGAEKLLAEVKGRTKSRPGAGVDSLYGQLLRRMPPEEVGEPTTRFAVVVPDSSETAVLRVPKRVRDALRIDIYTVTDSGQVEILSD
jgi:hypothetical protein